MTSTSEVDLYAVEKERIPQGIEARILEALTGRSISADWDGVAPLGNRGGFAFPVGDTKELVNKVHGIMADGDTRIRSLNICGHGGPGWVDVGLGGVISLDKTDMRIDARPSTYRFLRGVEPYFTKDTTVRLLGCATACDDLCDEYNDGLVLMFSIARDFGLAVEAPVTGVGPDDYDGSGFRVSEGCEVLRVAPGQEVPWEAKVQGRKPTGRQKLQLPNVPSTPPRIDVSSDALKSYFEPGFPPGDFRLSRVEFVLEDGGAPWGKLILGGHVLVVDEPGGEGQLWCATSDRAPELRALVRRGLVR